MIAIVSGLAIQHYPCMVIHIDCNIPYNLWYGNVYNSQPSALGCPAYISDKFSKYSLLIKYCPILLELLNVHGSNSSHAFIITELSLLRILKENVQNI